MKVKYMLTRSEIQSLLQLIQVSCIQGSTTGLTHVAAVQILQKLYLKLVNRMFSLTRPMNSVSLSVPEIWAFSVQSAMVLHFFSDYERVLYQKICDRANQLTA